VSFGESTVYTSVVHGSANPEYGEKFTMYAALRALRSRALEMHSLTRVERGAAVRRAADRRCSS
jgi:hypothetical protein